MYLSGATLFHAASASFFMNAVFADVYLHNPRGNNDRCDEKNNNRQNANRLFDSQNAAAGGYATCDSTMFFYEGTELKIEWMAQHTCGNGAANKISPSNPELASCNVIIQVGTEETFKMFGGFEDNLFGDGYSMNDGVSFGRKGISPALDENDSELLTTFGNTCTQQQPEFSKCDGVDKNDAECNALDLSDGNARNTFNGNTCQCSTRKYQTYTRHEPSHFYEVCKARERNHGLFTATQNVKDDIGATATRQNPNGNRYGMECAEERDYYPYWHPTPWVDVAIAVSNVSMCSYYLQESQNVLDKGECVPSDIEELRTGLTREGNDKILEAAAFNNKVDCTAAGFEWKEWGKWNLSPPECFLADYSTDNRLGNVASVGDTETEGEMAHYNWKISEKLIPDGQDSVLVALRLRYNISAFEVPFFYDATNDDALTQNPVYMYGLQSDIASPQAAIPLRFAIDTSQYGRIFQDRSYAFEVRRRPSELRKQKIHNLNVRGKRGNIAQVNNALEYDFVPNNLKVENGDYIHFQTCGSDYNPDGNDGEGCNGCDRSNMVFIDNNAFDANTAKDKISSEVFSNSEITGNTKNYLFSEQNMADFAWLGQTSCFTTEEMLTTEAKSSQEIKSCHYLNGVRQAGNSQVKKQLAGKDYLPSGYYSKIAKVQTEGTFHYISSINNNFSNRSQKGTITVSSGSGLSASAIGIIFGVALGAVAVIGVAAGAAFFVVKKRKLSSRV